MWRVLIDVFVEERLTQYLLICVRKKIELFKHKIKFRLRKIETNKDFLLINVIGFAYELVHARVNSMVKSLITSD